MKTKKPTPKKPRNPMAKGLIIRHGSGEGIHGKTGVAKIRAERRQEKQRLKKGFDVKKNPSGTYEISAGVVKGRWGDEPSSRYIIPADYEVILGEDGSISAKKTGHPFGSGHGRFDRGLPREVQFASAAAALDAAAAEEDLAKPSRGAFEGGFYEREGRLSSGHVSELDFHREVSKLYEKLAYLADRFIPSLGMLRPNPSFSKRIIKPKPVFRSRPAPGMAEGYLLSRGTFTDITYIGKGDAPGYGPILVFTAKEGQQLKKIRIGRTQGDSMRYIVSDLSELEALAMTKKNPSDEAPEGYRVWQDVHGWWWESPGGFVSWYPEKTKAAAVWEARKDKRKSKALLPNPKKSIGFILTARKLNSGDYVYYVDEPLQPWSKHEKIASIVTWDRAKELRKHHASHDSTVEDIRIKPMPLSANLKTIWPQPGSNREAVSNRSRPNPKDLDIYDPREEQMRAQRQAIYESQVLKSLGLRYNDSFRLGSKRRDLELINTVGLDSVRTLIGRSMFAMGTRVQQRTGFVAPRTQQFTPKTAEASKLRYSGNFDELIQNRQDYEETLGIARKSGFYRVVPEITTAGIRYFVWPMQPGQRVPRGYESAMSAVQQTAGLNSPLDTGIWRGPMTGYAAAELKHWLPPASAFSVTSKLAPAHTATKPVRPQRAKLPKPGPAPKVSISASSMSYSEFCRARAGGSKDPQIQRVFQMKGVELTTVDSGDILAKFELRYRKGERA